MPDPISRDEKIVFLNAAARKELGDVVRWWRELPVDSTRGDIENRSLEQGNVVHYQGVGTAVTDIDPGGSGEIALQEGTFDALTEIAPQETVTAFNLTGSRIWGEVGVVKGSKVQVYWAVSKDSGGGRLIVESDAATRLVGTVFTAVPLVLENLTPMDGSYPGPTMAVTEINSEDTGGLAIGTYVFAQWNQSTLRWEFELNGTGGGGGGSTEPEVVRFQLTEEKAHGVNATAELVEWDGGAYTPIIGTGVQVVDTFGKFGPALNGAVGFGVRMIDRGPVDVSSAQPWTFPVFYDFNVIVEYEGLYYICINDHNSTNNKKPPNKPNLWTQIFASDTVEILWIAQKPEHLVVRLTSPMSNGSASADLIDFDFGLGLETLRGGFPTSAEDLGSGSGVNVFDASAAFEYLRQDDIVSVVHHAPSDKYYVTGLIATESMIYESTLSADLAKSDGTASVNALESRIDGPFERAGTPPSVGNKWKFEGKTDDPVLVRRITSPSAPSTSLYELICVGADAASTCWFVTGDVTSLPFAICGGEELQVLGGQCIDTDAEVVSVGPPKQTSVTISHETPPSPTFTSASAGQNSIIVGITLDGCGHPADYQTKGICDLLKDSLSIPASGKWALIFDNGACTAVEVDQC